MESHTFILLSEGKTFSRHDPHTLAFQGAHRRPGVEDDGGTRPPSRSEGR